MMKWRKKEDGYCAEEGPIVAIISRHNRIGGVSWDVRVHAMFRVLEFYGDLRTNAETSRLCDAKAKAESISHNLMRAHAALCEVEYES